MISLQGLILGQYMISLQGQYTLTILCKDIYIVNSISPLQDNTLTILLSLQDYHILSIYDSPYRILIL